MRWGFMIMLILLLSTACTEEESWSDEYKKSVAVLMKEVQIVEVAVNQVDPIRRDSIEEIYYEQFYEMHGISRDSLESILGTLRMDPTLAEEIYKLASDKKKSSEYK